MSEHRARRVVLSPEQPDADEIRAAGEILQAGGLVAFPTETVYGLGGNALDASSANRIYAAKGRPSDNPLIVHIADAERLSEIAENIPKEAYALAETCWPGPLTMVLKKKDIVPKETTGGLDTVAVRLPSNPIARALIRAAGGFVAAPSANRSGRPSPTRADHVEEDLGDSIDLILDGGPCVIGLESTIIDLAEGRPTVLRLGFYDRAALAAVIGEVAVDAAAASGRESERAKAPGMKYRHYAPQARLEIVDGGEEAMCAEIRRRVLASAAKGEKVGILCATEHEFFYPEGIVRCLGEGRDETEIAHRLYEALRSFDADRVDVIYSETYGGPGLSEAVMDRLRRAAGEKGGHANGKDSHHGSSPDPAQDRHHP